MGGDQTVCYDQARIEDAKGSEVEWLFPVQITVMRYLFATEGARWSRIPLVGDLGVSPSYLILLIIIFIFIKPWG